MDVRLPQEEERQIREMVNGYKDRTRLTHLHSRASGRDRYFELTMMVCQHASVGEAHHLTEHLEEEIRGAFPRSRVVTHVEPCTLEENVPCPATCPVHGTQA